jgi:hypothetical protein
MNEKSIFLHMPKTAGSTLRNAFYSLFKENLVLDYNDTPINIEKDIVLSNLENDRSFYYENNKIRIRNDVGSYNLLDKEKIYEQDICIYGHFLPNKYYLDEVFLKNTKFFTFLRDPICRSISHYYFWKRNSHSSRNSIGFRKKVFYEMNLEEFMTSEIICSFYQNYFYNFDYKNFNFVGITENFKEDFETLNKLFFSSKLIYPSKSYNVNNQKNQKEIDNMLSRIDTKKLFKKEYEIFDYFKNKSYC